MKKLIRTYLIASSVFMFGNFGIGGLYFLLRKKLRIAIPPEIPVFVIFLNILICAIIHISMWPQKNSIIMSTKTLNPFAQFLAKRFITAFFAIPIIEILFVILGAIIILGG